MKKGLGIFIVVILVLVIGFYAFNSYIYNQKQADGNTKVELLDFYPQQ